jgi:hypothetical protein
VRRSQARSWWTKNGCSKLAARPQEPLHRARWRCVAAFVLIMAANRASCGFTQRCSSANLLGWLARSSTLAKAKN